VPEALGVSFDRVKTALDRSQDPLFAIPEGQPTFRVRIVEKQKPWVPDFRASLKIPWQPVPNLGINQYEIMNMITPPQAQPYGAFNSRELPQVMATSLVTSLMMYGLQKAGGYMRDSWYKGQEQQARDQVRRELEEFLRAHPEAPKPLWWFDIRR
jgi:hypothetical protein